ncbi:MAG: Sapep family Mn(2+)-dependent dipeptidase [Clostridia bacterium]|nr:Sapep family Mn(2+)-dependent dipeptidase [Clostridia bacterium]
MDKLLEQKVDQFLKENRDNIVNDLIKMSSVPAVRGEAGPGAPFGKDVARALQVCADVARDMGLETTLYSDSGYAVSTMGEGEKCIGFFGHADVVPAGDGWTMCQPFEPTVIDGVLYGRGVVDNKAGLTAGFYTMKAIRDLGIPFSSKLVTFIGGNEESGMKCLRAFVEQQRSPDVCITADSSFPVCCGEKTSMSVRAIADKPFDTVIDIKAGTVSNAVAAYAEAVLPAGAELRAQLEQVCASGEGLALREEDGRYILSATGLTAHASRPHLGKSGLKMLLLALAKCPAVGESDLSVIESACALTADDYGEAMGLAYEDEQMGKTTMVCTVAATENGRLKLSYDNRVCARQDAEELARGYGRVFRSRGFDFAAAGEDKGYSISPGFYIPPTDPVISAAVELYRSITGDKEAEAYTMGGGTYARLLKNAFAFGPTFPGRNPVKIPGHGGIHQPDEALVIDDYMQAMKIYILSTIAFDKTINNK